MNGAAAGISPGGVFDHNSSTPNRSRLGVSDIARIDPVSIAVLEFECDAPRTVHMDRVPDRLPVQTMEVKAEHVHVFGKSGIIELVEPSQDPCVHLRIDFRRLSLRPEIAKSLVPEGLYQGATKRDAITIVSYLLT